MYPMHSRGTARGFPSGPAPGAHPWRTETRILATLPSCNSPPCDETHRIIASPGRSAPSTRLRVCTGVLKYVGATMTQSPGTECPFSLRPDQRFGCSLSGFKFAAVTDVTSADQGWDVRPQDH